MTSSSVVNDPVVNEHVELARSLAGFASQFPWIDPPSSTEPVDGAWRQWVLGFVRAATAMLRAACVLSEQGLGHEAGLQVRTLIEAVANLYYMGEDHRTRALEYAREQAVEQARLVERSRAHGVGDTIEIDQLAERFAEDREFLRSHLGDEPPKIEKRTWPFNCRVETRMASAGMHWHHDLAYEVTSNLAHMNARAVAAYIEGGLVGGFGNLALANEMMIRVLYKADGALGQGQGGVIDAYGREHALRTYPGRDTKRIIAYLRGEIAA